MSRDNVFALVAIAVLFVLSMLPNGYFISVTFLWILIAATILLMTFRYELFVTELRSKNKVDTKTDRIINGSGSVLFTFMLILLACQGFYVTSFMSFVMMGLLTIVRKGKEEWLLPKTKSSD